MTYAELQRAGAELTAAELGAQLRLLLRDPRAAALAALLDRNVETWQTAFSGQQIPDSHGKLAHAAGSLHAILLLRAQVATAFAPPRPRKSTPADQAE